MGQFSVTEAGDEWTVISKSPLDREDKDRYNLKIIATDGRFQTSTNVEVHVLDLNDNSPLCEQVSQICVFLQLWTLCLCGHVENKCRIIINTSGEMNAFLNVGRNNQ